LNIKFYPILQDKNLWDTATDYDETVRFLFNYFQKSVGILGVGTDGHIAGLLAGVQNAELGLRAETNLARAFDNLPGDFKERISLTFLGISKLDQIIVMIFGKDKKWALQQMFKSGLVAQIPARFLTQKNIEAKVTLITDQSV
jgi:6-phosphogluconolactonase/glucosamine-6-phosphate isomerase/deaminase